MSGLHVYLGITNILLKKTLYYATVLHLVIYLQHCFIFKNCIKMDLRNFSVLFFISMALFFVSCEKDDPKLPNEEELITTVTYTLTAQDNSHSVVLSFEDLDGDGGANPVIVGGTLRPNTSYNGTIVLTDASENPAEDITAEIANEDEEHQFFYSTTLTGLSIAYADQDGNGNPLGLLTNVVTTESGSGTLTVVLRHEPNKSADGVQDGDISNAGGETDIEISFPLSVQN